MRKSILKNSTMTANARTRSIVFKSLSLRNIRGVYSHSNRRLVCFKLLKLWGPRQWLLFHPNWLPLPIRVQDQAWRSRTNSQHLHYNRHYEPLSITEMNRTTTHPGEILKEELEARGISQKKFSEVLSVPYTQLNEILNGKRPVTTDFALMMEAALGINPEMLINMQSRYNMSVALQKKPLMTRLMDIKRACAAVF